MSGQGMSTPLLEREKTEVRGKSRFRLARLGPLVVLLVLTRFEPRVYGIAAVMLVLAFVVQAIPWRQATDRGESPAYEGVARSETRR